MLGSFQQPSGSRRRSAAPGPQRPPAPQPPGPRPTHICSMILLSRTPSASSMYMPSLSSPPPPSAPKVFTCRGTKGGSALGGAGAAPNPAAGGGPAPPAPSRGPRGTHPGHQGALQEELQQLGDGHVHVAGAGRAARRRGGSLGRQRRRAHGPAARQLPPTAATPRGPSPSGPRGRTGAAPPPPEPAPGRRPPPRGAARARDRRGQRAAPWEAERPPGGRPPRGGAAARNPRRYRSETHAVRRSRSAQRAPSVPLRPPRYLWRGAPSRRQLEPGRGRAVTGGARGQWAPPSDRRGPMGRPRGREGVRRRGAAGRRSASAAAASVPPRRAPGVHLRASGLSTATRLQRLTAASLSAGSGASPARRARGTAPQHCPRAGMRCAGTACVGLVGKKPTVRCAPVVTADLLILGSCARRTTAVEELGGAQLNRALVAPQMIARRPARRCRAL